MPSLLGVLVQLEQNESRLLESKTKTQIGFYKFRVLSPCIFIHSN